MNQWNTMKQSFKISVNRVRSNLSACTCAKRAVSTGRSKLGLPSTNKMCYKEEILNTRVKSSYDTSLDNNSRCQHESRNDVTRVSGQAATTPAVVSETSTKAKSSDTCMHRLLHGIRT